MSCNCFDISLGNAEEHAKAKLPKHRPETLRVRWVNGGFAGATLRPVVTLPIAVSFRAIRTNGEPYKNTTHKELNMAMSYCPFCGESLQPDEQTKND